MEYWKTKGIINRQIPCSEEGDCSSPWNSEEIPTGSLVRVEETEGGGSPQHPSFHPLHIVSNVVLLCKR